MPSGDIYDQRFFDQQASGSLRSARSLLPEILSLVGGASLIDIGCGVGPWLRAAQECGITKIIGLDGSYVDRSQLLVGEGDFRQCDLETENLAEAVRGMVPFDLAVCVEVAEHLTESRAVTFVSELCQLSDVIAFSAAIPGQGGTAHVNEQWPAYWVDLFSRHSFTCFDAREQFWGRRECEWWYLQNLLFFARDGGGGHTILSRVTASTRAPMPLVHPRALEQKLSEFAAHVGELNQLLIYQPFGRDEAIRVIERRADDLRTLAVGRAHEIETARAQADHANRRLDVMTGRNERLLRELDAARAETSDVNRRLDVMTGQNEGLLREIYAVRNSTSWQVTRPLRMLKAALSPKRSS